MRFFKNPVVAVLLSAVIILASTLGSVKVKFGAKVQEVNDVFLDGMEYNGERQASIASHLRTINHYAGDLLAMAERYDVNAEDVEEASEWLRLGLQYSADDASYMYYEYDELSKALDSLGNRLSAADISQTDRESMDQIYADIADEKAQIHASGYNDTVRAFYKKYAHFPTDMLASLAGVYMPGYFQ